jgi:hypothetical protein
MHSRDIWYLENTKTLMRLSRFRILLFIVGHNALGEEMDQ